MILQDLLIEKQVATDTWLSRHSFDDRGHLHSGPYPNILLAGTPSIPLTQHRLDIMDFYHYGYAGRSCIRYFDES